MRTLKIMIVGWLVSSWLVTIKAGDVSQYSSKAALFGQQATKQQVAAAPREGAGITEPDYALSSKPWLSPQGRAVTPATEPDFVAVDKYNSKKGARGEHVREFQVAPLK